MNIFSVHDRIISLSLPYLGVIDLGVMDADHIYNPFE